jgi:SPP1 family phage portal protein
MYYTFTIPREKFDETNIDRSMILRLISKHYSIRAPEILKNVGYYFGKHAIMNREKKFKNQPNNKIMVNHAKDISDTATGYFLSNPITFKKNTEDGNIDKLTGAFVDAETDDTDSCNAINMSRAGVAYEYVYLCEHESKLMTKTLDPLSTFKVFDSSIEQHELFSVYYSIEKDDSTDRFNITATVTSENYVTRIGIVCNEEFEKGEFSELGEPYPHFLGEDPIIEYRNNMWYYVKKKYQSN